MLDSHLPKKYKKMFVRGTTTDPIEDKQPDAARARQRATAMPESLQNEKETKPV